MHKLLSKILLPLSPNPHTLKVITSKSLLCNLPNISYEYSDTYVKAKISMTYVCVLNTN